MLVKTNDLKKGVRVRLANGWYATIADNTRGDVRTATVEGVVTETGGIYSHDIVEAEIGGYWVPVSHTANQLKMRQRVTTFGF